MAAALLVAGCTDADWSRWTTFDSPREYPVAPPPAAVPPPPAVTGTVMVPVATIAPASTNCERTALERRGDAEAQGFDEDTQKRVYDATYADCMTWAARMGGH
ncbi:MAG: hypothetical protein JO167_15150 [Alphaproteobacteria bacterium]|nr:hypothetical protein [Alphaproteobacteria bacterium]